MKAAFKTKDDKILYHAVFFSKTPLFIDINDFKEGEFCIIKANMLKPGEEHSLINIFNINKLY